LPEKSKKILKKRSRDEAKESENLKLVSKLISLEPKRKRAKKDTSNIEMDEELLNNPKILKYIDS